MQYKCAQACINTISYMLHILLMNSLQLKVLELYKETCELFLRLAYMLAYVTFYIYH